MRPNNQNKRSRGRNNGNRRNSNPLSRNYESNGPDVKIRGNASHVAEKYMQLARDAQTVGDSVMEQNYLQHAEHYLRIVAAAQAQNPQRIEQPRTDSPQPTSGAEERPQDKPQQDSQNSSQEAPKEEDSKDEAPKDDTQDEPVVASENDADAPAEAPVVAEASAERPKRKPRERRPRRKPAGEEAAAENPAEAEQPGLGELPAFLTGGGQTDAAE